MANENETVEEVCAEMRSFGNVPPPMFAWRDLAERAEAAHKRELAAKDEEIDSLKWKVENYAQVVAAKGREIAKRDALIKELVELLNKLIPNECYRVCGKDPCDHIAVLEDIKTNGGEPCPCVLLSALVAKAREVSNG